jgi:hypothetical protein
VAINLTFNFPLYQSPAWTPPPVGTPAAVRGTISPLAPNANNQITVDISQVSLGSLLEAGFTPAPAIGTTAARPTAGLYPAATYFDTTLGTPIWRNAANTGWVNSAGSSV